MRSTALLFGLMFLANSCAVSHPPAMKPADTVRAPAAAPIINPPAIADVPATAPATKPTVRVDAPATTPGIAAAARADDSATAPVSKPTTAADVVATAPLAKPTSIVEAPAPAPLINPNAGAGPPAGVQPELPADASADQVLDALDHRGKSMREFVAKVSLTSGDPLEGDVSTRVGRLTLQKKGDEDARLRVTFDKRVTGRMTRAEKTEVLLDNRWLVDRDYGKKSETKREVARPGEKMNLLKLGDGPFPLPLGQKKEDVKELFDVTLLPVVKQDGVELADNIHLKLTPKPNTHFARRFGAIDIWVSRKSSFPVRIDTVAPDGSDPHTTKLEDLKINPEPGLTDGDFTLPKIGPDWSQHTEPYRE